MPLQTQTVKPLEILVVENHPDTLKYLRMYLEALGHTVRSARTVEGALDQLAEAPGDVLLSDIGLPDGDGWELMRRAHLPESVFAIAMSGLSQEHDKMRSVEAGFRHHLIKPFAPEQLDAFLEEAWSAREGRS